MSARMKSNTLIKESGKHGRRCDATCHNARSEACSCICGGRYHGKGAKQARELFMSDFENYDGPFIPKPARRLMRGVLIIPKEVWAWPTALTANPHRSR